MNAGAQATERERLVARLRRTMLAAGLLVPVVIAGCNEGSAGSLGAAVGDPAVEVEPQPDPSPAVDPNAPESQPAVGESSASESPDEPPTEVASVDSAPGDSAPGDSAPGDSAPGASASGASASGDEAPYDGRLLSKTFDDIKFDIEPDAPFDRSMLTEPINDLNGKRIRIRGYILPTPRTRGIKQFVLVRDDQECCFGPGAALYDCIFIEMEPGKTAKFSTSPVAVEGAFRIEEFMGPSGRPLAIYRMAGEAVEN